MIKAIIFDLDGVIVNSEPAYKRVDMRILDLLGICMPDVEYDTWMGTAGDEMFKQLKDRYGFSQTVKELSDLQLKFMLEDFKAGGFGAIEGAVELVTSLGEKTDYIMAVASSSPMVYIKEILNKYHISRYFDFLISGESLPRTKPAPDIYIECARNLAVRPSDCLVLEDSKNGVTAAKSAGMTCIAFSSSVGRNQETDLADYTFQNMKDIEEFLLGMARHV